MRGVVEYFVIVFSFKEHLLDIWYVPFLVVNMEMRQSMGR